MRWTWGLLLLWASAVCAGEPLSRDDFRLSPGPAKNSDLERRLDAIFTRIQELQLLTQQLQNAHKPVQSSPSVPRDKPSGEGWQYDPDYRSWYRSLRQAAPYYAPQSYAPSFYAPPQYYSAPTYHYQSGACPPGGCSPGG